MTACARRLKGLPAASELAGSDLLIDGFNVLTTIEAALGGAVVLACRDETYRDIAGLHGTYRAWPRKPSGDCAAGHRRSRV